MAKSKHRKANSSVSNAADRLVVVDATLSNADLNGRKKRHVSTFLKRKKSNLGKIVKHKMRKIVKHGKINLVTDRNSEESDDDDYNDYPSFLKRINISSDDDVECEDTVSNNKSGDFFQNLFASGQTSSSRSYEESYNSDNQSVSTDCERTSYWNHKAMDLPDISILNSSDSEASNNEFVKENEQSLASKSNYSLICRTSQISEQIVNVIPVPKHNMEVVVLEHPSSILLYKYIAVKVIAGCVSVHGYQMNPDSPPMTVFSSERTGLIKLFTEQPEELWKRKELYKAVKEALEQDLSERLAQKILSECGNSSVIVTLQRAAFPPQLQFLQLYYPSELKFLSHSVKDRGFTIKRNVDGALNFNTECDNLAELITSAMRKSELKGVGGQRIVVYGPKNSGKSALLRYLINKVLHMFSEVYYLDADPGQTEFTPPGVLSITKVTKPLIGPPFVHQKDPVKMIFTGSHSAETSPPMYQKSIFKLMAFFRSNYLTETLFVNTMGWMQGIGLECLYNLMKDVKPTILIEIMDENKPSTFNCEEFLKKRVKYFKIQIQRLQDNPQYLHAPLMRNLSIMSYFGRCQMPHLQPVHLNMLQPVCVSWDKIAVYIFGKKLVPHRIVEAVNASVVALCTVDESLILESDVPNFQRTLQDEPDHDCIGLGLVRAVNEEKHLLYIVTPLSLKQLSKVNAIMRGNILVPDAMYLEQPIYNTPIPYVDQPLNPPVMYRRNIPKRKRRKKKGNEDVEY